METIAPGTNSSAENQALLSNLLQAFQAIQSFNGNVNHVSFANIFFNAIPKDRLNPAIWNRARLLKILTTSAVQVVELLEEAEKEIKERSFTPEFSKKSAVTLTKIADRLNAKLSTILQSHQAQKNTLHPMPQGKSNFSPQDGRQTIAAKESGVSFSGQRSIQPKGLAKNLIGPVRLAIQTLSSAKCLTSSDAASILNKLQKTTLLIDRMLHANAAGKSSEKGSVHSFEQAQSFSQNLASKERFSGKQNPLLNANSASPSERRERPSNLSFSIFQETKEEGKKNRSPGKQKCEQVFKVPKTEELLHLNHKKPSYSSFAFSSEPAKAPLAGTEKILTMDPKHLLAAPYTAERRRDRSADPSKKKQKKGYFSRPEEEFPQDDHEPLA